MVQWNVLPEYLILQPGKLSKKQGIYLDVGCNKGFMLSVAIDRGWDVYGAEIVPELTIPFGNPYKQFRDHVFAGRFCDVRPYFSDDKFDLITAIDVIEHFEDLDTDFQGISEILKPGGYPSRKLVTLEIQHITSVRNQAARRS